MRVTLGALAFSAILGLAGAALADEATGTIEAVDADARTILLNDGSTYTVAANVAIEELVPGTEVTVTYSVDGDGDEMIAEQVTPVVAQ